MLDEVLAYFIPKPGCVFVDTTAGKGGHLAGLAELVGEQGRVIAFDRDLRAHQEDAALGVAQKFPRQVQLIHAPFSEVQERLLALGIENIDGLLCDLGVSSHQLDDPERGFSLKSDGPIDMRMDQSCGESAYEFLKNTRESDLADILYTLGDERKSRAIAKAIKAAWPIKNSTLALSQIIVSAIRPKKWSATHAATKSFQAIRMAVNGETSELQTLLAKLPELLNVGGVAVFISFHSIEDRMVKLAFKALAHKDYPAGSFTILTKKPMIAGTGELTENRRARSAKLRAIKRVA